MAKDLYSKNNPVPREAISQIQNEEDFIQFLRGELDWPIPLNIDRLEDVAIPHDLQKDFGFAPEEDRIQVSRLLNLSEDQPWGIFLFEFKTKRPYLSHLRRLLRVLGSQRTVRRGDPIWDRNDILFICTNDWRSYQFVHFSGERAESAMISSFGWKRPEDRFLHTLCKHNLPKLRMPEPAANGAFDPDAWRTQWREAFNIKPVTDEFYATLKEVFQAVESGVSGLKGEQRRAFTELLVNRLIFLKFVEKKGWLDNDPDYLYNQFKKYGSKRFWKDFLFYLFFEGMNTDPDQRSPEAQKILGEVPYLNAELFALSTDWDDRQVDVSNGSLDLLFDKLLNPYNFTISETSPLEVEVAFNQDLLGYAYEELIADQHGQGAYYTHPTEVNLMCRESLRAYLETRCPQVDREQIGLLVYGEISLVEEQSPIPPEHAIALYTALHDVTVCDPAVGSGTFPVAMVKHIFTIMRTLGQILADYGPFQDLIDRESLTDWRKGYELKLHIIERSIYGCDIDYFAVQIAKLRFWIELMVDCYQPVSLPNFDFKLIVGDALLSVVQINRRGEFITLDKLLGHPTNLRFQSLDTLRIREFADLKRSYYKVSNSIERQKTRNKIISARDQLLKNLGIAISNELMSKHVLWQIDFAEIFQGSNPGFDIILANPPYIRHENIEKDFKEAIYNQYNQFTGNIKLNKNSDIYIYFYLRGFSLLKISGVLCFICSNSWLDVGYGAALQEYVLKYSHVMMVIENSVKRSFESAEVNTTINLFKKIDSGSYSDNKVKFISIRRPFEDLSSESLLKALRVNETTVSDEYRIIMKIQSDLFSEGSDEENTEIYTGNKWGGKYLRSPDIFSIILQKGKDKLTKLSDIVSVETYLNTGGADPFFIVRPKTGEHDEDYIQFYTSTDEIFEIESKWAKPFIKSPSELSKILVDKEDAQWFLIVPPVIVDKFSLVYEYILWGEEQGFNERSGCRNRNPWWKLPPQANNPGIVIWSRLHHEKHIVGFNPLRIPYTNFYALHSNKPKVTAAILNSSLFALIKELMGKTNFGGGVLKTDGNDIKQFPFLDIRKFPTNLENEFENILESLMTIPMTTIIEDINKPAHKKLDDLIFDYLMLSDIERDSVYEELIKLVERRLKKARSV